MTEEVAAAQEKPTSVECPARKDPAVRWFILAAMLIGMGVWCYSDTKRDTPVPPGLNNAYFNFAFNYYMPFVAIPPGVGLAIFTALFLRRVLVAGPEGIGYKGGKVLSWADVQQLDARELKNKGIVRLMHGGAKLTLDSWKLGNFKELMIVVETNVPQDKWKRE